MRKLIWISLTVVIFSTLSCSGLTDQTTENPQEEPVPATTDETLGPLSSLAKDLEDAAKKAEDFSNQNIDPVDFRVLSDMLPTSVSGLEQLSNEGEKSGISGMAVSHAEAEYADASGNKKMEIKITDAGSMTSLVAFGMAWMNVVIDRESSTGYEKTTTIDGHPALEEFEQREGKTNGEITVVVANRYIVEVSGSNVDMTVIKSALGKINLAKLNSMKNEGVTTAE